MGRARNVPEKTTGLDHAGFVTHAYVDEVRPEVNSVLYRRLWADVAVSVMKCGLMSISSGRADRGAGRVPTIEYGGLSHRRIGGGGPYSCCGGTS